MELIGSANKNAILYARKEVNVKINRVEQHQINKQHPLYKVIDDFCFRSKNLYNAANYIIRKEFINNKKYIKCYDMDKLMQQSIKH
jgi:putative transposase